MRPCNLFLTIAFPASLIITGCDKEDAKISQRLAPDAAALHQWFDSNMDALKQHYTLNSSIDGEIMGEQGTILQFNANDFTLLNGDAVTGNVDIELIEVYDRASMLLTKTSTNGKTKNGSVSTLISGGEFYVNAKQNGSPLKLKSGFTIIAPAENTGTINQNMTKFDGINNCEGTDCDLVWEEAGDRGIEIGEWQTAGGVKTVYYVFQNKFGWTNIDRWYNDSRPKTKIFVDVPNGFDNTNCAIYMTYDNEPVALASFDMYDQDKKLFTEHYGLIPVGLEVHFILVSIIDNEIHYATQGTTITENHVEIIESVKPISEEKLVDLIYELP